MRPYVALNPISSSFIVLEVAGSNVGGGQFGRHALELAVGTQMSVLALSKARAKDCGGVPIVRLTRYRY